MNRITRLSRRGRLRVEIGPKCRVESIDHVAQTYGQADVDELLCGEMASEIGIQLIIDALEPCRFLRITHDGGLRGRINAVRQHIVSQVAKLLFGKTQAPTEHRVGWDSVETVVDRGRRDVRQLAVLTV